MIKIEKLSDIWVGYKDIQYSVWIVVESDMKYVHVDNFILDFLTSETKTEDIEKDIIDNPGVTPKYLYIVNDLSNNYEINSFFLQILRDRKLKILIK